jgi:O-glycosyl hydrolase
VFGREGVAMACLWELNINEQFTYAGLRAFRNYDGQGGAFEDTSVRAQSSDIAAATVYASVDSTDPSKMVIVAINKSTSAKTTSVKVRHTRSFTSADVHRVTSASPTPVAAGTIEAGATNAFLYTMPPQSISILVPQR